MTMDATYPLVIEEADGLACVTLNRPERFNALGAQMVTALREYFEALARRSQVRVVILRGEGKHFCAGLDLKEQTAAGPRTADEMMRLQHDIRAIMLAMRRCPQPIVGVVHGAASGGGFAIALACDVRLGTPDTRMNAAAVRIGLTGGDMGISYFLPRMIGSSAAAEYLLTGRFIEAPRALGLGLLSQVGTRESMDAQARDLASEMLQVPPLALQLTKEGLTHAVDAPNLESVMAMEDRQQVLCTLGGEFQAGIRAFLDKRPAR